MPLPSEVRVLSEPAATRLILPRRQITGSRWMNFVPILFGMVFTGFALFWMIGASGILERPQPPAPAPIVGPEAPAHPAPPPAAASVDWFRYVFALFGLPFLIVGLIPIGIGILAFFPSHAEIIVTSDTLLSRDHVGPFRFRRRRPISQIGTLRIGAAFERSPGKPVLPDNHGIFAEAAISPGQTLPPPLRIALRYPVHILTPVAEFLRTELQRRGSTAVLHSAQANPVTLTVDPDPDPDPPAPDRPARATPYAAEPELAQPDNSKINFLPAPDALTFIIPRTGFRGTALFFLTFSLFWDSISFSFFGVFLYQFIRQPSLEHLGILAFLSLFVAIGIGTSLGAIQAAFRHSVLVATADSLVFTQTGPIRKSEFQWPRADLVALRCADSSTSVNEQPLKEILILGSSGKQKHILVGRAESELQWLAVTLRRFYRIRA